MKVIRLFICLFLFISIAACSKDNSTFDETTESFRTIIVSDYTGNVDITRSEGDKLNAYAGLGLYNGDDVKVLELSDLTLDVDSDKHLYAEEKTHFWLEAAGSEGHTKTKIHLESGSILCRVIKALNQDEAFEINTKTSTMSVRGTVFEVALLTASDGTTYELINVFDGKVVTKIEGPNKEITVMPGQAALVRESEDGKTSFVMTDQIDPEFWQSPDTDIVLIKQESDLDSPFFNIPYEKMPSETIAQLVEMAKDGEELCDTIDTLETIQTYGHEYVETSRVEPTCTNDGVRHLHCNICGHEIDEVLPALGHNFVTIAGKEATCTENGLTDGSKCDRCGKWGTYQKNIPALGHDGDPCKRCGGDNPAEPEPEPEVTKTTYTVTFKVLENCPIQPGTVQVNEGEKVSKPDINIPGWVAGDWYFDDGEDFFIWDFDNDVVTKNIELEAGISCTDTNDYYKFVEIGEEGLVHYEFHEYGGVGFIHGCTRDTCTMDEFKSLCGHDDVTDSDTGKCFHTNGGAERCCGDHPEDQPPM